MATDSRNLDALANNLKVDKASKIAVITAEWNPQITSNLKQGCTDKFIALGIPESNVLHISVPGTVELTYAAAKVLSKNIADAIVVIGSVIRGETAHFDYVCQSVTQGITQLNLKAEIPVIFCVLTDDTLEQAKSRSGGKHGNKGEEAAIAALQMIGI
tara:strand:+ start:2772 stop:3245 length:474 start_codon:yes stop_codon:yes gene_type:complete